MLDDKGRLWITQAVRPNDVPDWCLEGSDHPFALYYPIQHRAESRQVSYYDPETGEFELIDTCYFTHHLQFADDEDDTLWLSGSTEAIGWLNTAALRRDRGRAGVAGLVSDRHRHQRRRRHH